MNHRLVVSVCLAILVSASAASAERFMCPRPISVPDRWTDQDSDGVHDPGEPYDPNTTGFKVPEDLGSVLVLNSGSPLEPVSAGSFFAVNYPPLGGPEPPLTGGGWFTNWFHECSPYIVYPGDTLLIEPGVMVGPAIQAVLDLIASDSQASWDTETNSILDSEHAVSPRVVVIPLFDPMRPPDSSQSNVHVVKFLKVFLESVGPGSQINTRIMDVSSEPTPARRVTWSFLKGRYR